MGKITVDQFKAWEHERDDLVDHIANLYKAELKKDRKEISTQRERITAHLKRIEEIKRLIEILEDC